MERDIAEWERRFQAFFQEHPLPPSLETLDYLGVRLEPGREPEIKTYLQAPESALPSNEVVRCMKEQGLLGHLETVADSSCRTLTRFDARLERRGLDALEALLERLLRENRAFEAIPPELRRLSAVCFATPEQLLCHLGLGFCEDQLRQVKCYLRVPPAETRAAGDTDALLLERLSRSNPDFERPAEAAARLLRHCGGRLWMLGADYGGPGRRRKVYLRNHKADLRKMAALLPDGIGDALRGLAAWEAGQSAFYYSAAALCGDRERESLNLYFVTG